MIRKFKSKRRKNPPTALQKGILQEVLDMKSQEQKDSHAKEYNAIVTEIINSKNEILAALMSAKEDMIEVKYLNRLFYIILV